MAQTIGISDVRLVASYSWIGTDGAVILVPGMPGTWNQQSVLEEPVLEPDRGERYIDNNAGRCPKSPAEPLIRAVLHQQPDFDFSNIDLITDRHTIAALLKLLGGETDSLQCMADVAGNTIIFERHESHTKEVITTFVGCRSDFEKHYLTFPERCQGTASHHRIVTYKLGDVQIMVRHGADDMIGAQPLYGLPNTDGHQQAERHYANLVVRSGGQLVPQESTLELAVKRWKPDRDFYKEKIPQLRVSQTPRFLVTNPKAHVWSKQPFQRRDKVPRANVTTHDAPEVQRDVAAWEADHQGLIGDLHSRISQLLQDLRVTTGMTGQTRYRLMYDRTTGKINVVTKNEDCDSRAALLTQSSDLFRHLDGGLCAV
ncbi:hypothetical protein LTR85_005678 [Meristemomyces frigidus]|nr:hypothetical protein LTR85_005678 [Meristemomyces frigidus]